MRIMASLMTAAAALALAPAAQAADIFPGNSTFVPNASFIVTGDPYTGPVSATYGRSGLGVGTFTDNFIFTIGADGIGSGSITSILAGLPGGATDLDFLDVKFDNGTQVFDILTSNGGSTESGGLANVPIFAGVQNTLSVTYESRGAGSYGGSLAFEASAVPEPATWGMMLLGFGAMGLVLRRRRQGQTKVSYAF